MKKFIRLDIYVSQDSDKPLLAVNPNFSFSFDLDDEDEKSYQDFCDKRFYVETVVSYFRKLGCLSFYELIEKSRPEII